MRDYIRKLIEAAPAKPKKAKSQNLQEYKREEDMPRRLTPELKAEARREARESRRLW